MGASQFCTKGKGKTAKEAFVAVTEEARHESGHGGYTGTIAEKRSFVTISVPSGKDPREYANSLLEADDRRITDKWGPAGCVTLSEGEFLFFGWASD